MTRYIVKRLVQMLPVLLGVTLTVFLILHLTPGDPAQVMLGPEATPESIAQLREELGLNRPIYVQYFLWLARVVQGDLGRSFAMKAPVGPLVWERFKATFILTVSGLAFSTVVGILAGLLAVMHLNSVFDRLVTALALFGVSMPVFWLGLMAILFFSLRLSWFPVSGMQDPSGGGAWDLLRHLVLPAVTMGTVSMGTVARFTRSSLLEVFGQDFIRTAKAKGVSPNAVLLRHTLRNAWIPVVTVVGLQLGYLLGGAVLTEKVFSWPGLGSLMLDAILQRDFPVIQGGVLLIAVVFVMVNLAVDVLYVYLDPRIQYED
ncbi:MAG: ABC transporter permease [Candidatus Tectomicrobia bacterium]|uniref:ABC transporter permease n=1 Tax=Tectimicrobiota bacterium TaxID=2528274 RepID=A0A932HWN3_UNCTE|nr:ABC transporter permease [Candidatus Tectomicrobia bacterium]